MAWNQSNQDAQPTKPAGRSPSLVRGLVAGVLVAAVGAAVVFFLPKEKPQAKPEPTKKPAKIEDVQPAHVRPAASNVAEKAEETDPSKKIVGPVNVTTNAALGKICEVYKTADGKTHKVYRPARRAVFKHQTDQLLAMALCGDDKVPMPPLPLQGNLDKQFLDSLSTPIEILPDDSPKVAERKKRVIEARKQVDELMRQGIGFTQILQDHQKLLNENRKIRQEMVREIKKFNAEGDAESTKRALDKVNAALREMGISEIEAPKTREERLAEREARRAARAN